MSAFENPKVTNLTITGSSAKIYSKGVDKSSNSVAEQVSDFDVTDWSVTAVDGDYTLS